MKTKAAKIYLKTPERKWLWRGGVAACALPVLAAIVLSLIIYLDGPRGFNLRNIIGSAIVGGIPITGTIIAAYLGTRKIRKTNPDGFNGKSSIVWIAIKSGFLAHISITFLLFAGIVILAGGSLFLGNGMRLLSALFLGGFYTLMMWGIITLPLSIFSGFAFWFIALRGGENPLDVFD